MEREEVMELVVYRISALLHTYHVLSKNMFTFFEIQFLGVEHLSHWVIKQEKDVKFLT